MNRIYAAVIDLLKVYVTGEAMSFSLTPEEWQTVYKIAKKQTIVPIIWSVLNSCETNIDINCAKRFLRDATKAGYVYGMQERETRRISASLGEKGIRTMHFKGSFLGQYYPEPTLRTSCDIDILYEEAYRETACEIMKALGYTFRGVTDKEDEWFMEPCVAVEMHFSLFGKDNFNTMKQFEPWEGAAETGKIRNQHQMTRENQYVFMLFHFVKHLRQYGVNLRQILDFEFYLRKEDKLFNQDTLKKLLETNGLDKIDTAIRHLLNTWFHGGERDKNDDALEHFLINSGMKNNINSNRQLQMVARSKADGSGNKRHYFFRRIFPLKEDIRERYPIAEKYRILTPLFYVVRWFQVMRPSSRKRIRKETEIVRGFSEEEMKMAETIAGLTAGTGK